MSSLPTELIDDANRARLALSPLRRQLLQLLRTPGSAASLSVALGMPRQKIGYHLRALEAAGLISLVEERARRGFVERLLVARADAFIVDPAIMGATPAAVTAQDRYAAEHLVQVASEVVREVTRMRAGAEGEGKRLLTFTIEADIGFARPQDLEDFTNRLAQAVADLASVYAPEDGTRRYRLVIGGHPAVANKPTTSSH
jgi:DNA-binding transcriptional ArsR family regulator